MSTKHTSRPRARFPATADHELIGLNAITVALAEIVGVHLDRASVHRFIVRGIRGHRIAARRIGHRWATTRAAIEAFARASGALPEAQA